MTSGRNRSSGRTVAVSVSNWDGVSDGTVTAGSACGPWSLQEWCPRPKAAAGSSRSNAELLEAQVHPVPCGRNDDLMDRGGLWQVADKLDGLRQVVSLQHPFHVLLGGARGARLE